MWWPIWRIIWRTMAGYVVDYMADYVVTLDSRRHFLALCLFDFGVMDVGVLGNLVLGYN